MSSNSHQEAWHILQDMGCKMINKRIILFGVIGIAAVFILMSWACAAEVVNLDQITVCCEKTLSGLFCQNVPVAECAEGAKQVPTSCESTSYCKNGYCFDSNEGTCSDKVSQLVCNANNGLWSETQPPQCGLGCCVLGDQAAFVTLTRCKRLSSFLGLNTNFKTSITDEVSCVLSVRNQDKGACVYEFQFEKLCKFTTRDECAGGIDGNKGDFFAGKLCSAEELGTTCGPTTKTMCVPGKDEVYFVDTCGNPANIYDSSKVNDKDYWTNYYDKTVACGADKANENSPSCGNCNYLLGSFCRDAKKAGSVTPTYGDNICTNLNCKNTQNGNSYKHGESWCVYTDKGPQTGANAVGSRFYKHICINGEEVVEQCADFRNEICIQGAINTTDGPFSQAACRANRWIDCVKQSSKGSCLNTDKRDCKWIDGKFKGGSQNGACVPLVAPGVDFWSTDNSAKKTCSVVTDQCTTTLTEQGKSIFAKGDTYDHTWCGDSNGVSPQWAADHNNACGDIGDCGKKINWVGVSSGKFQTPLQTTK